MSIVGLVEVSLSDLPLNVSIPARFPSLLIVEGLQLLTLSSFLGICDTMSHTMSHTNEYLCGDGEILHLILF